MLTAVLISYFIMKSILAVLFFLTFFLNGRGQAMLFGIYDLRSGESSLKLKQKLYQRCDNTFKLEDSIIKIIVIGTWSQRKNNELILIPDIQMFKQDTPTKAREWKYFIKEGKLLSNGEIVINKETYMKYKLRQENTYLIKIDSYDCE